MSHFDKDVFVWSVNITVIETRRVYQCYISNSALLYARSHWFKRFHAFECAGLWNIFIVFFLQKGGNFIQDCGFTLTTLSENANWPLFWLRGFLLELVSIILLQRFFMELSIHFFNVSASLLISDIDTFPATFLIEKSWRLCIVIRYFFKIKLQHVRITNLSH